MLRRTVLSALLLILAVAGCQTSAPTEPVGSASAISALRPVATTKPATATAGSAAQTATPPPPPPPMAGSETATSTLDPAPYVSIYARVRPFVWTLDVPNIYIPNYPQGDPTTFPATLFFQYIQNKTNWTTDTEYVNLNPSWMDAMQALNGDGWNYLHNASDGTFFDNSKLGVDTFPGNVLRVVERRYRRGEWWDRIAYYPYTVHPPDLASLPPYLLGLQTGMRFSKPGRVYAAPTNQGFVAIPVISQDPGLWLQESGLELFPQIPDDGLDVMVMVPNLDVDSTPDPQGKYNLDATPTAAELLVETVHWGAHLRISEYYPTQLETYAAVIDPLTGAQGYVVLFHWNNYEGIYTTTWHMQTLPVPPG